MNSADFKQLYGDVATVLGGQTADHVLMVLGCMVVQVILQSPAPDASKLELLEQWSQTLRDVVAGAAGHTPLGPPELV